MKHICSSETVFHLCGITLYFNNLLNIKIKNDTFNWGKFCQMIFLRHMHCMSFHWCYPLSSRYRVVSMGLHGNTKCWNETPILWYEYWRFQAFFPSEKISYFPKLFALYPDLILRCLANIDPLRASILFALLAIDCDFCAWLTLKTYHLHLYRLLAQQ